VRILIPAVVAALAGCGAGSAPQGAAGPESLAAAASTEGGLIAAKLNLGPADFVLWEIDGDGARSRFVAFHRNGEISAIFESVDLGARGAVAAAYYFGDGALVAAEQKARRLSDAGAPSDRWYESEIAVAFADGRFSTGTKTQDGVMTEPDEHEVRALARAAADLRKHADEIIE